MNAPKVIFPAALLEEVRRWVLQDKERENHAFVYCGVVRHADEFYLLASRWAHTPLDHLSNQSAACVALEDEYVKEALEICRTTGLSLLDVHSHPWSGIPAFSGTDDHYGSSAAKWVADKVARAQFPENVVWAMMVVGQRGQEFRVWDPGRRSFVDGEVLTTSQTRRLRTGAIDQDRYSRQTLLWDQVGQERIAGTTVGIVGLGGLGCFVYGGLAQMGVSHFVLCDGDHVEKSNLNRLLGAREQDIGTLKTDIAARQIREIQPGADVQTIAAPFDLANAAHVETLRGVDLLIGCVDRNDARLALNEMAVRYLIPYFDLGSGIHQEQEKVTDMGGQVRLVLPGDSPCLVCLPGAVNLEEANVERRTEEDREMRRRAGYVDGTGLSPEPAVVPLNAQVAAVALTEASKFITGFDRPHYAVHVAILSQTTKVLNAADSPDYIPNWRCPTCGIGGVLGLGDLNNLLAPIPSETERIAAYYVQARRGAGRGHLA